MSNPKLLQEITVDSSNDRFSVTQGGAQNADMATGDYGTILELLEELEDELIKIDGDFSVTVSSRGFVTIACDNSFAANWAGTDDALETLLGFAGTESVTGSGPYTLTATKRHRYGWYSPVGVAYPGQRRVMPRRLQRTDDGDASLYSSSAVQREIMLSFSPLLEAQLEPDKAGTEDDGYGTDIDWEGVTFYDFWEDVADKKFRFYPDADDGTVADYGTEGTDYWTCVRTDEDSEPTQVTPEGYTYFEVTLPVLRVEG